ncbi:MAG: Gfo/Idh/MocA family oxidoreductase [Chloroflexi bacterium]|nr:Gfo/Idh/MocA family oxidoreductase [Chloroflexota bacterium]
MQASEPLRIGIVGTGFGQQTARVFQAHPRAQVAAICGRDPDRTAAVAAELAIPYTFTDYHEMISTAPIDAVAVVTPPHIHRPVAEAAISRGKHVLCQKPLAESVESARAMRDMATTSGIVHGMDQQFRTMPATLCLKDLLEEGAIGRPHSAVEQIHIDVWGYYAYRGGSPSKSAWFTEPTGGGFLLALGWVWDRQLFLFGPARSVTGSTRIAIPEATLADGTRVRTNAPDSTHAHVEFWSGLTLITQLAPARWGQHRTRLEILGDEGALLLSGPASAPVLQYAAVTDANYRTLTIPERYQPSDLPPGVDAGAFTIADRFVRAVIDGEPMSPSFDDALRTQELIQAIARSDETGTRQELSSGIHAGPPS